MIAENINGRETKNKEINQINERNQNERIDDNWGITSCKNTRGYRKNNKIYSEKQGINNEPPAQAIYGSDSDLGQRELNNSSFSKDAKYSVNKSITTQDNKERK